MNLNTYQEKALAWLKTAEKPTGGISAWSGPDGWGPAYPEVTGYLIPTLYDYGERAMAERLARWLLTVQHPSGGFPDMLGCLRAFDTAACMEGLRIAFNETGEPAFKSALDRARLWLRSQRLPTGALRIQPGSEKTHFYTMRASAMLRTRPAMRYWLPDGHWSLRWGSPQRAHYLAYGLEGLLRMSQHALVRPVLEAARRKVPLVEGLFPDWVTCDWQPAAGTCTVATAQFALLFMELRIDAGDLIQGICRRQALDGGIYASAGSLNKIAWGSKFFLDALREATDAAG